MITGNRKLRLELDKRNNSGSIVEVSNENSGTLDGLVLADNILDALTTKLDLMILPATVDNVAVGAEHGNISSTVDTLARHEGIGDERPLGLLRLIEISTSKLDTANKQLSFDTDGGRTQVLIKDVETVVMERATNDTSQGDIHDVNVDTINRSLGGTVHVHELDALRPVLDQLLSESFTGNNDGLQGWVVLKRNDSKDTGSMVNNVDAEVLDGSPYVTEHELLTSSDMSSTTGQGTEDVDDEGIESVGKRGENAGTTVIAI